MIFIPREPRVKSSTDIYHVILRGHNQTQLFYDDQDYCVFLDRVKRYKDECGFSLYAYCLMGNHIHLLIAALFGDLPQIIQKIALSYSRYFNTRYDRSGYLFQGRYKSFPVETTEYLVAVFRYIHTNPREIGNPIDLWTSYRELTGINPPLLLDTSAILDKLGIDSKASQKQLDELIGGGVSKGVSEVDSLFKSLPNRGLNDKTAIQLLKEIGNLDYCGELINKEKSERDRIVACAKEEGLSVRQIARLTGLNRGIVQTARMD